jgi:membrane protein implicated in regulation of membrane protease activity
VTTTVAQSGQSPWALLLVVILLAILLYLVARWLRSRKGKPGVKLFWQR